MKTPLLDQVKSCYGAGWSEKVKIKSLENTETLLNKMVASGSKSLQVIMDFDQTLSRYHLNGKKCEATYAMIVHSPLISTKVKEENDQLYEKYYPIAIDTSMSAEEKTPHMYVLAAPNEALLRKLVKIQWQEKSHESFLRSPLKHSELMEMVQSPETALRDNSSKLLETLHNSEIPTLILSAGMGNVIDEILESNSVNFPNVKVIANFMKFNECGLLIGFSEPLVHGYNKTEAALHENHSNYYELMKNRPSVILMGDSLGDVNMANGLKDANPVLKIGFLNCHISEHLPTYMEVYDVVLVDDQTMDFANSIMQLISH